MPRTWAHFPPIVPVEQFIDGADMHRSAHAFLECLLDGARCDQFACFGLRNKGGQQRFLISATQIGVKPTTAAIVFNGGWAMVVVLFHHIMDKITGDASMRGDVLGWPGIDLGIVDDQPLFALPEIIGGMHLLADGIKRQMGHCLGHTSQGNLLALGAFACSSLYRNHDVKSVSGDEHECGTHPR